MPLAPISSCNTVADCLPHLQKFFLQPNTVHDKNGKTYKTGRYSRQTNFLPHFLCHPWCCNRSQIMTSATASNAVATLADFAAGLVAVLQMLVMQQWPPLPHPAAWHAFGGDHLCVHSQPLHQLAPGSGLRVGRFVCEMYHRQQRSQRHLLRQAP